MTDQKAQGSGAVEIERDSEGRVLICTGCGTVETLRSIQRRKPSAKSCCPERKMTRAHKSILAALSQPPEASEVEAVAYLKFWWDGQSPRTRVDLSEICEPWLYALKPTITPLYAHPPKASPVQEDEGFDDRGDWLEKSIERINDMDPGFSPPKVEARAALTKA